ncbi:hypothetical protein RCH09_003497 [Actimicrobium sp. GrIS 1.19]|uniref:hypothetical protein n=1 Tax=Actimicrobium sp. GrIS 1.19 TaxID=3071708 RepID=UPI002DFC8DAB|nr:hypothetical protein [Actimicrobium sp. GrIS 1.19]
MKNILIATLAANMLGACGFMTPVKQYAGNVQAASDVAVIKGFVGTPFSDDFHSTIRGYAKLDATGPRDEKQFGIPGFTDYPSEIHVLAGEYQVQVYCFSGFTSYRPSTTLPLRAGKTYLFKCGVRDDQVFVDVHTSTTD